MKGAGVLPLAAGQQTLLRALRGDAAEEPLEPVPAGPLCCSKSLALHPPPCSHFH